MEFGHLWSCSNGNSNRALDLFFEMLRRGKIRLTYGTFVGVLLACVHSGLVDKRVGVFLLYVVDLLCRSGDLNGGYEFIKNMPFVPYVAVWRIFLSIVIWFLARLLLRNS